MTSSPTWPIPSRRGDLPIARRPVSKTSRISVAHPRYWRRALDPIYTVTGEAHGDFDEIVDAGLWLREYLRDLIARRRVDPGEDLMSGLIDVEEAGDQLTEEEIVATCNLLLIAGHETTVNLIANAVLAMLRHPDQWAALRDDPQRVSAVVEETLRYDPPVQLISRIAADDMTIGDAMVPKGDTMMLLLAAANHDPAAVDRPGTFDPDRDTIRHSGSARARTSASARRWRGWRRRSRSRRSPRGSRMLRWSVNRSTNPT